MHRRLMVIADHLPDWLVVELNCNRFHRQFQAIKIATLIMDTQTMR